MKKQTAWLYVILLLAGLTAAKNTKAQSFIPVPDAYTNVSPGYQALMGLSLSDTTNWFKWSTDSTQLSVSIKMLSSNGKYRIKLARLYAAKAGSEMGLINERPLRDDDSTIYFYARNLTGGTSVYLNIVTEPFCPGCSAAPSTANVVFSPEAAGCTFTQRSCDLVTDGDMEAFTTCGAIDVVGSFNDWDACKWQLPNSVNDVGTSDYFNTCAHSGGPISTNANVNVLSMGQTVGTHTNDGYCGIFVYGDQFVVSPSTFPAKPEYREYLVNHLNAPMIAGKTYILSMWVRLANISKYAIKDICMMFGNSIPLQNSSGVTPTTISPNASMQTFTYMPVTDKTSWTLLSMPYTAAANYDYVYIGNFRDDNTTSKADLDIISAWTYTTIGGTQFNASLHAKTSYYYIDDVSIMPVDLDAGPDKGICPTQSVTLASTLTCPPAGGTVSYSWTPSGSLTTPGASGTVASPSVTTNYTLTATITFTNGTSPITLHDYVKVSVTNISFTLTANASPNPICAGSTTTLTTNGGSNLTYTWTSAAGTYTVPYPVVSPTVTTTYTVTTINCGQTFTAAVTETVNPAPTFTVGSNLVCESSAVTVTTSSLTTINHIDFGDAASSTNVVNPHTYYSAGTYSITIDAYNSTGSCNTHTVIPITVVSSPSLTLTYTATPCTYNYTFTANFGCSSNGYDNVFSIDPIGVNNLQTSNDFPYTFPGPGTYTITLLSSFDNYSSAPTAVITVSANVTPTVTASASPSVICAGQVTTLSAAGANTYVWQPGGAAGSSVAFTPTATTVYTVTGTSSAGCTTTKTVSVSVNAISTLSITASPTLICAGSSTTLTASGASTYTWNTGPATASITVSPSVTTIYTVTGTNAAGCSGTKTVQVSVTSNPLIGAVPSTNSICPGGSATLTASGGTTYTWNPGTLTNTVIVVTPTVTTIYTLSANVPGCGTKTSTLQISVNPLSLTATASPTSACLGATFTLTASGANTYTWNPGALTGTSAAVTPTVGGVTVYTVTGTNLYGCTGTKTISLTAYVYPTFVVTPTSGTICASASYTLKAQPPTNLTFLWLPGGATTSSIIVTPTISTIYTVTATGATTGCSKSLTSTVTVNPFTLITASPSAICAGQTSTLSAPGATSYTWSTGAHTSSIAVTPSVTTVYTVTGTGGGCTSSLTLTLTVNPNPTVTASASPTALCSGQNATLTAGGAVAYSWNPGGSASNPLTVSPGSTTVYTVTGTSLGCSGTKTVSVNVSATPTVTIVSTPTIICTGGSATLTASGASSYSWTTGATTAGIVVTPTPSINHYTVYATTGNCTGFKTISVYVINQPAITVVASPSAICAGSSSTLTGSGGTPGSYTWSPGAVTFNPLQVTPAATMVYTVTARNAGCSGTNTVQVIVTPTLSVSAGTVTICSGNTATLTASGVANYTWSTGANTASVSVTPSVTTVYTVTGNSGGACTNSLTVNVAVNTTPALTASASPATLCVGNTTTLTASGAATYTWSTGATTAVTTVTPGAVNIYTVTSNNAGCIASKTLAIALTPQYCCQSASFTIGSGTSNINYSNNSDGGGAVIDVTGTITFTANSSMSNYVMRMAPGSKIFISQNVTMTFSNCIIYSCTELWDGIYLLDLSGDAGNLNVINTTIEDMYSGIIMFGTNPISSSTSTNGNVTVTNSKLNKNLVSILMSGFPKYNNGITVYGLSVTGSTISSVYSPTSPQSTLKTSSVYTYPYSTITNTTVPYTYFPRSYAGIILYDLTETPVIIGDITGAGGTNRFENLDIGIGVENAHLQAYNNHFINLTGSTKNLPAATGPDQIGVGITAISTTTTGIIHPIIIGDGSSAPVGGNPFPTGNKFEDCNSGVNVEQYQDIVKVKGNVFTTAVTSVLPALPGSDLYNFYKGLAGIWVEGTKKYAELTNNYVLNHNGGIYSSHTILAANAAAAYIKIEGNFVEAPAATGYCKQAIFTEQPASTTNLNPGMLTVKNNTLQNVYNGISASNIKGGLQINDNPTISIDAGKLYGLTNMANPATYKRNGIRLIDCADGVIANNPNITSAGTFPADYTTVKGIWLTTSGGTLGQVSCNSISSMGRSLQFNGSCINKVAKNTMTGPNQGFVLSANGVIGTQGSSSLTNDNEWSGFAGGSAPYAETYTENTNNANSISGGSVQFVKPGSPYQPTQNYSNGSFPYATGGAQGIRPQSLGTSGENCLVLRQAGNGNPHEIKNLRRMADHDDSIHIGLYEALASDTIFYAVYQDETQYRNKQLVYNLMDAGSIVSTDALQDFYAANQNGNYNTLATVNTAIGSGNYSTAQSINNAMQTNNTIEAWQKRVNELLVKYISYQPQQAITNSLSIPVVRNTSTIFNDVELNDLKEIANSCLDQYGNVVTQARVLVNSVFNAITDYEDNCIPEFNQRKTSSESTFISQIKTRIYPNPNNGNMNLEYDLGIDTKGEMRIFDVNGKLIKSYTLQQRVGKLVINDQTLINGVYYYSIVLNGNVGKTDKIIVIK